MAGFLNRGTAELVITGYGDDDADTALALARADHVRSHLLELGVGADRLTIEARPPADAPAGGIATAPVGRRTDLEIRYRTP